MIQTNPIIFFLSVITSGLYFNVIILCHIHIYNWRTFWAAITLVMLRTIAQPAIQRKTYRHLPILPDHETLCVSMTIFTTAPTNLRCPCATSTVKGCPNRMCPRGGRHPQSLTNEFVRAKTEDNLLNDIPDTPHYLFATRSGQIDWLCEPKYRTAVEEESLL